jgi:hypothetical protein
MLVIIQSKEIAILHSVMLPVGILLRGVSDNTSEVKINKICPSLIYFNHLVICNLGIIENQRIDINKPQI